MASVPSRQDPRFRERPPVPRRGWRAGMPALWTRWTDWVNLVLGAWLFISVYVLNTGVHRAAAWSTWLSGAAIFLIALYLLIRPTWLWAQWLIAALGLWVFISPWVLGFTNLPVQSWIDWVCGAIVFVVAVAAWFLWRRTYPVRI